MTTNKSNIGSDYIILFLVTLFFLHRSSFIGFHTPSTLWASIVTCLFTLLFFYCSKRTNIFLYLLPLVIISLIWSIIKSPPIDDARTFLTLVSGFMQFSILPLLTYYLFKKNNIKNVLFVFICFCAVEITTGISTIFACAIDPTLARMDYGTLRDENPMLYAYRMNLNVGDYHTTYGFTAMLPIVVLYLKNSHYFPNKLLVKLISCACCVVMVYTVYSASYTISLAVCGLMLLTFFCPSRISKPYFFISILLAIIIAYFMREFLPPLLYQIADLLDNDIMSVRLIDLADSLGAGKNTGDTHSDFNLRMIAYEDSWNCFLSNPILGNWSYEQSGKHSFILDNMGLMGLGGLGLILTMLRTIWKRYIAIFRQYPWFYYYGYALIAVFIFLFVNPDDMQTQLLFFYPISGYMLAYYTRGMYSHKRSS